MMRQHIDKGLNHL